MYVLIIRLCDLDGVSGEVDRNGQRLRNRRTTHQRTGQNACENIARAVHPFRGVFPVGFVELSRFAVIGGSAVTVTLADTGDDRRAASQFGQLFQIAVDLLHVTRFRIRHIQKQRNFCQIRCNHVCFCAKLSHFPGKVRRESGIHFSAVSHDRIHHDGGVLFAEQIEKVCNDLHLLSGTQIAGIDSVKVQI